MIFLISFSFFFFFLLFQLEIKIRVYFELRYPNLFLKPFMNLLSLYIFQRRFCLVSLFKEISTSMHYLMPNLSSSKNTEHLGWVYRILELNLCRRLRSPPPRNECLGYDTKQSDGEVPVIRDLWRKWSTPFLPLLRGSLWPGVVTPDRVFSMGQSVWHYVLMLNWIVWN